MTLDDLIDRIKTLPKTKARSQALSWALTAIVGPDIKGQYLTNLHRRELRKKIKNLDK